MSSTKITRERCVFVFIIILHPWTHAEHEKTQFSVSFCAWRLSSTTDPCRTRKGRHTALVSFRARHLSYTGSTHALHPWCTPYTKTHHSREHLCVFVIGAFTISTTHAEHEKTPIFCSRHLSGTTLNIKAHQGKCFCVGAFLITPRRPRSDNSLVGFCVRSQGAKLHKVEK
jgi:hypothetical protein